MSTPTPEAQLYLGDMRRAAALVSHHANKDTEGVTSVLVEANESDRGTNLLLAVCDLYVDFGAPTGHAARRQRLAADHPRDDRPRGGHHVTLKACLQCGEVSDKSRCPQHRPKDPRDRRKRGYDWAWDELSIARPTLATVLLATAVRSRICKPTTCQAHGNVRLRASLCAWPMWTWSAGHVTVNVAQRGQEAPGGMGPSGLVPAPGRQGKV